jgi:hypothetical protein
MPTEPFLPDRVLRQSADVAASRLGDTGVLVNLKTNRIFELNATGLRVWELVGEGCTGAEIERRLGEEFVDVTAQQLQHEVRKLLVALLNEALVE